MKCIPAFALVGALVFPVWGQTFAADIPQDSARPRLLLVITVDQMRDDYLDRFADLFCPGGFRQLLTRGARFTQCAYPYAATYTGPGHAVILSGLLPTRSGIIGNEWFDRETGGSVYCVQDTSVRGIGIDADDPAGRMSPLNFLETSLGDQLRDASPASRVIGIALKDRGAVLPAGKHPTGAYWFDSKSGKWISSTYYARSLPEWVERFNAVRYPEQMAGTRWTKLLPDSAYLRAGKDDSPGEGSIPGESKRYFPHEVHLIGKTVPGGRTYDALLPTPAGDDLTEKFSEAAIAGERLGQRGVLDILAVSFSSPDYCGHIFGPDSHEIEDIIVRLDRQLQTLFEYIDRNVGMQNTIIVLTADHGVCPLPERTGHGAARINGKDLLQLLKVKAGQAYSYDEGRENLLLAFSNNSLYLDTTGIRKRGIAVPAFEQFLIGAAQNAGHISGAYIIGNGGPSSSVSEGDSVRQLLKNSYYPGRSGDIAIICREYSFYSGDTAGTTHGSPYYYDRHVPLLLAGPTIRHGIFSAPCSPLDISATLNGILQIKDTSHLDGKDLKSSLLSVIQLPD